MNKNTIVRIKSTRLVILAIKVASIWGAILLGVQVLEYAWLAQIEEQWRAVPSVMLAYGLVTAVSVLVLVMLALNSERVGKWLEPKGESIEVEGGSNDWLAPALQLLGIYWCFQGFMRLGTWVERLILYSGVPANLTAAPTGTQWNALWMATVSLGVGSFIVVKATWVSKGLGRLLEK